MVTLSRIYTKSGDKGRTSLGSGSRVSKTHRRIEAIGSVDEANASLGICRLYARDHARFDTLLTHIQNDLFDVGADLCMPQEAEDPAHTPLRIISDQVSYLEYLIDDLNKDLTPLNSFVLPGGSTLASHLHLARTIVRRSERMTIALHEDEPLNTHVIQYLNRLSDLLFVMGRCANNNGHDDILWIPGAHRSIARHG